jgi:phospholipid/cholesterol/gamma-HCH transport system permease protein
MAALLLTLPALTILADGLIMLGGWMGNTLFLGFTTGFYLEQLRTSFLIRDLVIGLAKAVAFALLIGLIAADEGLNVERRVAAISEAATRTVVACLIAVLAFDTLMNAVFYFIPSLL